MSASISATHHFGDVDHSEVPLRLRLRLGLQLDRALRPDQQPATILSNGRGERRYRKVMTVGRTPKKWNFGLNEDYSRSRVKWPMIAEWCDATRREALRLR